MPDTVFTGPVQYLLTCGVLAVAQAVYVLFGFGSGLIAVGLLALIHPDLKDVVVMLLLVNLPAELAVSWRARRDVAWRPVAVLAAGVAAGIPIGTRLLQTAETGAILAGLGWFLIAVGLLFVRLPGKLAHEPPRWLALPTGLVGGVLNGLFGAGGPPVIVWYHLTARDKGVFRGSLMTVFLLMGLVRAPVYAVGGLITGPRLASTAAVLPAVLAGAWLGQRLHLRLGEAAFRRLVAVLLAVLGLLLLVRR